MAMTSRYRVIADCNFFLQADLLVAFLLQSDMPILDNCFKTWSFQRRQRLRFRLCPSILPSFTLEHFCPFAQHVQANANDGLLSA